MNDLYLNKKISSICLLLFSVSAFSQDNVIEEVFVTAEKRSESLQDISQAVTAISDQDIESKNIESMVDLSAIVPGVTVAKMRVTKLLFLLEELVTRQIKMLLQLHQ